MFRRFNIFKWIGWLLAPIQKNSAFFVFMFALGYLCTQWEVMPYYLRDKGAKPYDLSVPELFFDLYLVCLLLTLIPRKIRAWVRALFYLVFYGVALADMFCYERFESTLTPTMLMLVGETNAQEAQEFLTGYLSWDALTTGVRWVLLLLLGHIIWTFFRWLLARLCRRLLLPKISPVIITGFRFILGLVVAWLLYSACSQTWDNKVAMHRLFSYDTVGQVEHELTQKDHARLYLPVYRLAFGIYANQLASRQLGQLLTTSSQIRIDSCVYRVPNIVLVIGESYNKHHSQLYGYPKPTTPGQLALAETGSLVAYSDVVAPWNLTSFVFKHMLSLYAVGDSGAWCDQPLFPEVFRKAGYRVTFITNQFQSQAKEALYDFSGGFFLNDLMLSQRQFDVRNTSLHPFDDGVLKEYDQLAARDSANLVIFHLMGSHVNYRSRFPKSRGYFKPEMYDRPELSGQQKRILADYDNSLRYNDSIVTAITQRFIEKDAVVIYVPDHGEEVFDSEPYVSGRLHAADIDYRLARNEMEIPFWIWGSPSYIEHHPYGWLAIQTAKDRSMMTDALPHLLLYLGGISTPLYRPELNVIMPEYNISRPRILKGVTDYNQWNEERGK